jgi:hypothetical protein
MVPDYHIIGALHRTASRNSIAQKTAAKGLTKQHFSSPEGTPPCHTTS